MAVDNHPFVGTCLISSEDKKVPLLPRGFVSSQCSKSCSHHRGERPVLRPDLRRRRQQGLLRHSAGRRPHAPHPLAPATVAHRRTHLGGAERAGPPYCDPAADYAPPYDTASKFTNAKNVFFGGNLYRMNNAVPLAMPKGEIFVLKYDPKHRPCWDVVKDLGGYSVFISKNQTIILRYDQRCAGCQGQLCLLDRVEERADGVRYGHWNLNSSSLHRQSTESLEQTILLVLFER